MALLAEYEDGGGQKKRKAKSESPPAAPTGAVIPRPAAERFTAVNEHGDRGQEASGEDAAAGSFTAVNQEPAAGSPTQSTATTSAVDVLRALANSLAALPLPTDPEVVDRAKTEDLESAQLELQRISDWAAGLQRLISSKQETGG